MRILLIGSTTEQEIATDYYDQYEAFFRRALTAEDVIDVVMLDELYIQVGDNVFTIFNTKTNEDLATYDVILIRGKIRNFIDLVKTISVYAHLHQIQIINDYSEFRDSSKLTQAVQFFVNDITVASTVYLNAAVFSGAKLPFSFPCVMKAVFGSHGEDNHLVHNLQQIQEIAAQTPTTRYVLQRYIPNEGDYRVLLIGGEAPLVISRVATGDTHLNNTSQGGAAKLAATEDLPTEVIANSRKIARALGMTVAGVDVFADKHSGEFYFLEVNSQPQLMTGAFVDEKVALMNRYLNSLRAQDNS